MSLTRYALVVLAIGGGSLAALGPLLLDALGPAGLRAALAGAALAAANTLVAYGLVVWSAGRSTRAFMGAVLGGMLGRMALLLGALLAGILLLGLPRLPLALSLLAYFVLFLLLELAVVQRQTPRPAEPR